VARIGRRFHAVGNGKHIGRNRGIRGNRPIEKFCHLDTVDLIGERFGDLRATDRGPAGRHEIIVRIAVDVVVIARADGSGKMCRAIEQDGELRSGVSE